MTKVNVKINGSFRECELIEVINKGYGPDETGEGYAITDFVMVVKLPNGEEAVFRNPELK